MPTIIDVAKAANVSTATVSRVLNAPEKVSPETLSRVQKVIEELNYNPTDNRRSLMQNNTRTFLVIMPDFENMFLIDVLSGINEASLKYGYSILLFATNSILERERETLKFLNKKQADGVIIICSTLNDDELKGIASLYPLVQCCEYSNTSPLPHVSINNYAAFCEATEFLLRLGYQKIALLSSTKPYSSTFFREAAFKDTLSAHGIEVHPSWLRRVPDSFITGYEGMQALLRSSHRPRAVLTNADTIAVGAIRAIHDAGLSVPDDIAVMGTDNLEICQMVTPTLTTTSQPRKLIGKTAVEMLIRQIAGETNQQSIFLPHELIVRNST